MSFTVLALVAAGCGGSSGGGNKTATIGLLAPLTGTVAADGTLMKNGAELAVHQLNNNGGVDGYKFKLKIDDVGQQTTDAVASAARDMIGGPGVKAVITGYASTTNFEINTFAQAGMPYLIAGNSAQTRGIVAKNPSKYPTIWSLSPSYDAYGTVPIQLVQQLAASGKFHPRNHKAFVITSNNPYSTTISNGLIKTLTSSGWTISANETVPFGPIYDWGTILAKVRAANPDLIINTDYQPGNEASFLKQFLQNPTKSLIFLQYGPAVPQFLQLTGKSSTGVLYDNLTQPILSNRWPTAVHELAAYSNAYHSDPGAYGTFVYDEVMVYADALRKVGNPDDKAAIGRALGATKKDVSFGVLQFDPATHLAKQSNTLVPLQLYQLQNGKRVQLYPPGFQNGPFVLPPWF
jgi:branched-chain amino acid transport system substrate-binding protein